MNCDVGEATEGLENELLILQPFRHFTYVTTHSPTLPPDRGISYGESLILKDREEHGCCPTTPVAPSQD